MRPPTPSRPANERRRGAGGKSKLRRWLSACLVAVILPARGCTGLPEYALPHLRDFAGPLPAEVIAYRQLDIADFRAPLPPAFPQGRALRLNAHAAVAIRSVGARYASASLPPGEQGQRSCGRIENLRFEAVMVPQESWWRPDQAKDREGYVLQHEQIHFALMEVAARRLTRRSALERDRLILCDAGAAKAKENLTAVVKGWLAESREEVIREHTLFDEDTSGRFAPEAQQRWYDRVDAALRDLAAWD